MPLVYQQNINHATRLGVWHIIETESEFLRQISLQNSITHPHKRLQHLAGRNLLRDLFPDFPLSLIMIADTKKPFLQDEAFHFSISHCADYAAAIVSTDNRVGVDIEIPQDKILRIRNKFLNDHEQITADKTGLAKSKVLTMCWSIKEAIFKWYGKGQVDFRKHMIIKNITDNNGLFRAECDFVKEAPVSLFIDVKFINGNCLAWIVT